MRDIQLPIPITVSPEEFQELAFEDFTIENVHIYAIEAFSNFDAWYSDLIDRVIPSLGEEKMGEFIDMGFDPFRFLIKLKRSKQHNIK